MTVLVGCYRLSMMVPLVGVETLNVALYELLNPMVAHMDRVRMYTEMSNWGS